jgi:hypothetical protein
VIGDGRSRLAVYHSLPISRHNCRRESERRGMRTMKSTFGLVGAAIPVLICAGLVLYFNGVNRSFGGMLGSALGPTMVGLGVIGLLFLIRLVLKIRKLAAEAAAPAAPGGGGGPADRPPQDAPCDLDPDAAVARYMAKRPPGPRAPGSPFAATEGGRPAGQPGFGRKGA